MKLLVRPEPVEGESWVGYLVYLADVNEFESLAPIAAAAGVSEVRLTNGDPSVILERLGIASSFEVSDRSGGRRGPGGWKSVKVDWRSAVCTECIRQGRTRVPSVWAMPLELMCTEHGCELLRSCPRCGLDIDLGRFDWRSCDCGCSFAEVAGSEAPRWMLRMSQIYRHELKAARSAATFAASSNRENAIAASARWLCDLAGMETYRDFFSMFDEPELKENVRNVLLHRFDWRHCLRGCGMEFSPQLARFLFDAAGLSRSHLRCAVDRAYGRCQRSGELPAVGRLWRYAIQHVLYECSCPRAPKDNDWSCGWVDVSALGVTARTVNAGLR